MREDEQTKRKVKQFLKRNRKAGAIEPWDYVEKTNVLMHGGKVVAVAETMANGDAILTIE